MLGADERYPYSAFVEDTAVVSDRYAIVANPGVEPSRGGVHEVEKALSEFRKVDGGSRCLSLRLPTPGAWEQ